MRAGSKQSMPAAKKELSQRTDFLRPRLPEVSSTDIALTVTNRMLKRSPHPTASMLWRLVDDRRTSGVPKVRSGGTPETWRKVSV